MPAYREYHHKVPEGVDWVPLDLLVFGDGTAVQHNDVASIAIRIFRVPDTEALYELTGISAGSGSGGPIYDTPVLDGSWKQGPPGYNSKHRITPAARAFVEQPGQKYRCEILTQTNSEGLLPSVHVYEIVGLYGHP